MTGYKKNHQGDMASLSALIRKARRGQKVSQEEISRQMGISRQTYAKKEENPEGMTIEELFMVSDLLGVRATDLLK